MKTDRQDSLMMRSFRRTIKQCSVGKILILIVSAALVLYLLNSLVLQPGPMQDQKRVIPDQHDQPQRPMMSTSSVPTTNKEPKCGISCPVGKYAYNILSGENTDQGPSICFNGETVINSNDNKTFGRGLNVVIVSDKTKAVIDRQTFDLYAESGPLLRYLKLVVFDGYVLLAASMDDMQTSISKDEKGWLKNYGSAQIENLKFRDNFVMVGQRGLASGGATEKIAAKGKDDKFAKRASIQGCLSLPMGEVKKIDVGEGEVNMGSSLKFGRVENCGMKDPCPLDHFAVHIYSGVPNKIGPSVCVDDKYVISDTVNKGGRGFNVVIYSPKEKTVIKTGKFDTYAIDSSNLEIFLEAVKDGEIVVAVTHDDASTNLKPLGRKMFGEFGSTNAANLGMREGFCFIGQKGIMGATPFEQLEYSQSNGWPNPIDKTYCVPNKLVGKRVQTDPVNAQNEKRQAFCKNHDGYTDFCDVQHRTDPLVAAQLTDKYLLNGHEILKTPIIVVAGMNHNNLRMTLETVLMQPGVPKNEVYVTYDEKYGEVADLVSLFEFNAVKLSDSTSYSELMEKSLDEVAKLNQKADNKYMIVIEEDLMLSPDFLSFMAYTMDGIDKDETIIGASAWNPNGFAQVSGNVSQLYRVSNKPGLGFMIRSSFYKVGMSKKMKRCCAKRAWEDWSWNFPGQLDFVVPDISRVIKKPPHISAAQPELKALFLRPRTTNLDMEARIDASRIKKDDYEAEMRHLVASSTILHIKNVQECIHGKGIGFYVPDRKGSVYSVHYEQSDEDDYLLLGRLCKCFGLFYAPGFKPKNLHNGVIRFFYKSNTILLVGSKSPYVSSKSVINNVIPKSLLHIKKRRKKN